MTLARTKDNLLESLADSSKRVVALSGKWGIFAREPGFQDQLVRTLLADAKMEELIMPAAVAASGAPAAAVAGAPGTS